MADASPITQEEYRRLCDYLYRRTGMTFNDSRRYFVDRRVADRMAATGATSFASYFARLRSDLDGEVEQFINAFTVNETYFYREDHQLQCLTADLLAERLRGEGARRSGANLVGAVLDGRRALFHRDVAAGELAAGGFARHRDHWLRHRHVRAGLRARRWCSASAP